MAETPLESKNNPINKSALRSHFIQIRNSLHLLQQRNFSKSILKKILSQPNLKQAQTIAVYISTPTEVDTHALINYLLKQKKQLYAPAITTKTIVLRKLETLESCIRSQKNILEPPPSSPTIDPTNIDLFIVPGLGFDSRGNRLGYGKGYYDQLLQNTPGYKIGIAFTDQLCYFLPKDPWDVRMHQVISEQISLKGNTLWTPLPTSTPKSTKL